jgi:hypothetical protein
MTAAIAIYFFSGACSLTYEIIWQRLLKIVPDHKNLLKVKRILLTGKE